MSIEEAGFARKSILRKTALAFANQGRNLAGRSGVINPRSIGNYFAHRSYAQSSGNVTCQLPLVSFAPVQNAPHT